MNSGPSAGLGRGLRSILTGTDTAGPSGAVLGRLVEVGLAAVLSNGARQLCAHLWEDEHGPELVLRSPELRSMHPTKAYQLFTALSATSSAPAGRHDLDLSPMLATAVVTIERGRRSTFFLGDTDLSPPGMDRLVDYVSAHGSMLHQFDRAPDADETLHLVIDQRGGASHAEVELRPSGGEPATGFGSAPNADDAIATAALATTDESAKLESVGEARGADGAVHYVVCTGADERLGMGAAPVDAASGAAMAVAVAAIRAARSLHST